jgi:hypothetical protein
VSEKPSEDVDRAKLLIELYGNARQRFAELEKLYWKVNFSIWGFFGAVAYFLRAHDNHDATHLGRWALLLILAVPIHFEFLRRLGRSQSGWRSTAEHYRDHALALLNTPVPSQPALGDIRKNDLTWILLAPLTTALMAGIVMNLFW